VWVAAVLVLLTIAVAIVQFLSLQRREGPALPLWDIPRVAGTYTTIVGTLSGFTVASAVFIGNQAEGQEFYEDAMGMFIVAFLLLISSTMQFASTPNLATDPRPAYIGDQHLSYVLANSSFYLGVAISWLGLRMLLLAVNFTFFADILTWLLLFSIVAGAVRLSMHLYRHTTLSAKACFACPFLALGLGLLLRFGLAELWSDLWPADNIPLSFATMAFFVGGTAYLSQTALLSIHGEPRWEELAASIGPRWLLTYAVAAMLMVVLLWIAVAEASAGV
jgi:hypothetical protein